MAYKKAGEAATKNGIAELAKRVPPNQALKFKDFQTKHAEYRARVNRQPDKLPNVDWEYYKRYVRADFVKMVDEFEQKYKGVCEAFDKRHEQDTSKYFVEIDRLKQQVQDEVEKFKAASNERIKALEAKYAQIQALIPYEEMTAEEYAELLPDKSFYRYRGEPSFWPHTPDEQGPGPSAKNTYSDDGDDGDGGHYGPNSGQGGSGNRRTSEISTSKIQPRNDPPVSASSEAALAGKEKSQTSSEDVSCFESQQFKKDLETFKKCFKDQSEKLVHKSRDEEADTKNITTESKNPNNIATKTVKFDKVERTQIYETKIDATHTTTTSKTETNENLILLKQSNTSGTLEHNVEKDSQKCGFILKRSDLPYLGDYFEEIAASSESNIGKEMSITEPRRETTLSAMTVFMPFKPAVEAVSNAVETTAVKSAMLEGSHVKVFCPTSMVAKANYSIFEAVDSNCKHIVETVLETKKSNETVQIELESSVIRIPESDATRDLQQLPTGLPSNLMSEFKAIESQNISNTAKLTDDIKRSQEIHQTELDGNKCGPKTTELNFDTVSKEIQIDIEKTETEQKESQLPLAKVQKKDAEKISGADETKRINESSKKVESPRTQLKTAQAGQKPDSADSVKSLKIVKPKVVSPRDSTKTKSIAHSGVFSASESFQSASSNTKAVKDVNSKVISPCKSKATESTMETFKAAEAKEIVRNYVKAAGPIDHSTLTEKFKNLKPKVFSPLKTTESTGVFSKKLELLKDNLKAAVPVEQNVPHAKASKVSELKLVSHRESIKPAKGTNKEVETAQGSPKSASPNEVKTSNIEATKVVESTIVESSLIKTKASDSADKKIDLKATKANEVNALQVENLKFEKPVEHINQTEADGTHSKNVQADGHTNINLSGRENLRPSVFSPHEEVNLTKVSESRFKANNSGDPTLTNSAVLKGAKRKVIPLENTKPTEFEKTKLKVSESIKPSVQGLAMSRVETQRTVSPRERISLEIPTKKSIKASEAAGHNEHEAAKVESIKIVNPKVISPRLANKSSEKMIPNAESFQAYVSKSQITETIVKPKVFSPRKHSKSVEAIETNKKNTAPFFVLSPGSVALKIMQPKVVEEKDTPKFTDNSNYKPSEPQTAPKDGVTLKKTQAEINKLASKKDSEANVVKTGELQLVVKPAVPKNKNVNESINSTKEVIPIQARKETATSKLAHTSDKADEKIKPSEPRTCPKDGITLKKTQVEINKHDRKKDSEVNFVKTGELQLVVKPAAPKNKNFNENINSTKVVIPILETIQASTETATSQLVHTADKASATKLDEEIISSSQRNKQAGVLKPKGEPSMFTQNIKPIEVNQQLKSNQKPAYNNDLTKRQAKDSNQTAAVTESLAKVISKTETINQLGVNDAKVKDILSDLKFAKLSAINDVRDGSPLSNSQEISAKMELQAPVASSAKPAEKIHSEQKAATCTPDIAMPIQTQMNFDKKAPAIELQSNITLTTEQLDCDGVSSRKDEPMQFNPKSVPNKASSKQIKAEDTKKGTVAVIDQKEEITNTANRTKPATTIEPISKSSQSDVKLFVSIKANEFCITDSSETASKTFNPAHPPEQKSKVHPTELIACSTPDNTALKPTETKASNDSQGQARCDKLAKAIELTQNEKVVIATTAIELPAHASSSSQKPKTTDTANAENKTIQLSSKSIKRSPISTTENTFHKKESSEIKSNSQLLESTPMSKAKSATVKETQAKVSLQSDLVRPNESVNSSYQEVQKVQVADSKKKILQTTATEFVLVDTPLTSKPVSPNNSSSNEKEKRDQATFSENKQVQSNIKHTEFILFGTQGNTAVIETPTKSTETAAQIETKKSVSSSTENTKFDKETLQSNSTSSDKAATKRTETAVQAKDTSVGEEKKSTETVNPKTESSSLNISSVTSTLNSSSNIDFLNKDLPNKSALEQTLKEKRPENKIMATATTATIEADLKHSNSPSTSSTDINVSKTLDAKNVSSNKITDSSGVNSPMSPVQPKLKTTESAASAPTKIDVTKNLNTKAFSTGKDTYIASTVMGDDKSTKPNTFMLSKTKKTADIKISKNDSEQTTLRADLAAAALSISQEHYVNISKKKTPQVVSGAADLDATAKTSSKITKPKEKSLEIEPKHVLKAAESVATHKTKLDITKINVDQPVGATNSVKNYRQTILRTSDFTAVSKVADVTKNLETHIFSLIELIEPDSTFTSTDPNKQSILKAAESTSTVTENFDAEPIGATSLANEPAKTILKTESMETEDFNSSKIAASVEPHWEQKLQSPEGNNSTAAAKETLKVKLTDSNKVVELAEATGRINKVKAAELTSTSSPEHTKAKLLNENPTRSEKVLKPAEATGREDERSKMEQDSGNLSSNSSKNFDMKNTLKQKISNASQLLKEAEAGKLRERLAKADLKDTDSSLMSKNGKSVTFSENVQEAMQKVEPTKTILKTANPIVNSSTRKESGGLHDKSTNLEETAKDDQQNDLNQSGRPLSTAAAESSTAKPSIANKAVFTNKIGCKNLGTVESFFKDTGFGYMNASVKGLQVKVITSSDPFEPTYTNVSGPKVGPLKASAEASQTTKTDYGAKTQSVQSSFKAEKNYTLDNKQMKVTSRSEQMKPVDKIPSDIKTQTSVSANKKERTEFAVQKNLSSPSAFRGFTLVGMPQDIPIKNFEAEVTRPGELFESSNTIQDHSNIINLEDNASFSRDSKEEESTEEPLKPAKTAKS